MSRRYDCSDPEQRADGLADAISSVRRGDLVVLPTDTVYGIGADAFSQSAVKALLDAKGRGRDMPVPVLVGSVRAATALIHRLGTYGQDLLDEFWPGALTVVCRANPSLSWDLGDTKGTVALRMPLHDLTIELLKEVGPMAVSSANLTGRPPARTAAEAEEQFGDAVAVYLDGGLSGDASPSTIVDLTADVPRLLRAGAIPEQKLRDLIGVLLIETDEEVEAREAREKEEAEEARRKEEEAKEQEKEQEAAGQKDGQEAGAGDRPAEPATPEAATPAEPEPKTTEAKPEPPSPS